MLHYTPSAAVPLIFCQHVTCELTFVVNKKESYSDFPEIPPILAFPLWGRLGWELNSPEQEKKGAPLKSLPPLGEG